MTWLNSIQELQFYNQPAGVPCYCQTLLQPSDIMLQGSFPPSGSEYTIFLRVYSADGLTLYEDATSYFDVWFGVNPVTLQHFFTARLNQWADSMCEHKCFIIRAIVTAPNLKVFDKYTERYCQSDCCNTASGVIFAQEGVISVDGTFELTATSELFTDCGDKLIKIITVDDCYNKFLDEYYSVPPVIISGDATFTYSRSTIMKGRIVRRPREIQRDISYNCKLQRVESTPVFLLEGFEYLPPWKMFDLEGQLHSQYIWVQDVLGSNRYEFAGGVPFRKVEGANSCTEIFKLETEMQECRQRQVFGCSEPCDSIGYEGYTNFFIIPSAYAGNGFYGDDRSYIAADTTGLIDYLRAFADVTDVAELAFSPASDCDYYAVIGVAGNGYLPNTIYYGIPTAANRIFAVSLDEASEVCNFVNPNNCATPVLGVVTLVPVDCATPVLGDVTMTIITPEEVGIIQYIPMNWEFVYSGSPAVPEDTEASVYNNQVTFSIKARNYGVPEPELTFIFSGEVIGVMGAEGRPSTLRMLTSANNGSLTDEQTITIDEYGLITYSGPPTDVDEGNYSEVQLSNLIYNL